MSSLAYDSNGQGPVIVLLHGYLENRNMWQNTIAQLKSVGQCISIDLPGHGQSAANASLSSLDDIAVVVHDLLASLQMKNYHIVGHSLGAYIALAYAKKYPDCVQSILCCHSTSQADSPEKKVQRDRAIIAVEKYKKTYLNNSIPFLFHNNKDFKFEAEIAQMISDASQMSTEVIKQYLLMMKERADNSTFLENSKIPTGYIIGKFDPLLESTAISKEAQKNNATTFFLEESGHMGHIEETNAFTKAICQFIALHKKS